MGVIIGYIEVLVVDSFCIRSESISVRQNETHKIVRDSWIHSHSIGMELGLILRRSIENQAC